MARTKYLTITGVPNQDATSVRRQLQLPAYPRQPVASWKLHMLQEQLRRARTPLPAGTYPAKAVVGDAPTFPVSLGEGRYAGTVVDGYVVVAVYDDYAWVWKFQAPTMVLGPDMLQHGSVSVAPWLQPGTSRRSRRRR